MSSSIGNALKITIFGESHSKAIGMTIDGLPAGTNIDIASINNALAKRKTNDSLSTTRNEVDEVIFLCGVFNNKSTGTPLTFIIENKDVDSSLYKKGVIRPSHSDYVNYLKNNGFNDYRGGGFSSGRITASLIVLGAISQQILDSFNIKVFSHIKSIHKIHDVNLNNYEENYEALNNDLFPVLDNKIKQAMADAINNSKAEGDSVGGQLETVILNCPIGLGEPYFDSFESYVSQLIFSIGGVKGIRFGNTDQIISSKGSEVNDSLRFDEGQIKFNSNYSGGVDGGMTNGQPIIFTTDIKPTSSIAKAQDSVNLETKENIELTVKGRHDPCIVHRVRPVIEAVIKFAILDLLMTKESKNLWK